MSLFFSFSLSYPLSPDFTNTPNVYGLEWQCTAPGWPIIGQCLYKVVLWILSARSSLRVSACPWSQINSSLMRSYSQKQLNSSETYEDRSCRISILILQDAGGWLILLKEAAVTGRQKMSKIGEIMEAPYYQLQDRPCHEHFYFFNNTKYKF